MHDFERETNDELAAKMAALDHLIREADRAAARLEAALAAARQEEAPPASQADALRPAAMGAAGISLEGPTGQLVGPASDPNPAQSSRRRCHEEVYQLADSACDSAEIARQLGVPIGEIELILSLRDSR